jgi:2-oxoglutarate ferredoxin oxidoreductase subunit gamma
VQAGGTVFINGSLISIDSGRDDVDELNLPVVEMAKELGNVKTANIIALAAFVARSGIVGIEALKASVKEEFSQKKELIPLNMKAIDAGIEAAKKG